jgi:hypothetical protein
MCEFSHLRLDANVLERTVMPGMDNLRWNGNVPIGNLSHGNMRPMGYL